MGNKKIVICIVMFLVIFFFGIIGPDFSNREKYREDKYSNTSETEGNTGINESVNSTEVTTIEVVTEATTTELTTEEVKIIPDDTYVLSEEVENKIDKIIDDMTLEEKVGQVFFIKNDGRFDEGILDTYPVGGVILFKGDFAGKSAETVRQDVTELQSNSKIPLLIGIDEEGGSVIRLSYYSNLVPAQFNSPRFLYNSGGFEAIEEDTRYKADILLSYGINVNFAPVCDIPDSAGDFIYKRSFSEDVELTNRYVELMVDTMEECNVGSVLKHFPGYGNNGDTHNGTVRDLRPLEDFEEVDLIPFKTGIDSGAWCVLVSHNIVECMDKEKPASLSAEVHRLLREDLEFGGVIITDDLMMGGVANLYSKEEAAVEAVLAGNDMILATDYQVQYKAVLNAVETGTISETQLEESIRRILRWKYNLGILDI